MEDLSKLSNEELFKMLKRSGINAGPITPTTRSVYEKKMRNHLKENTVPVQKVQEELISPKKNYVEPEPEIIFAKPTTPKEEKPVRSILRRSTEEKTFDSAQSDQPIFTKTTVTTIQSTTIEDIMNDEEIERSPVTRASPIRSMNPPSYKPSPVREVAKEPSKIEFKLLNKPQQPTQLQQPLQSEFANQFRQTPPNIRKRTAVVDRSSANEKNETKTTVEKPKASSGFLNIKYMVIVMIITAIVYLTLTHLQANPENPVEIN